MLKLRKKKKTSHPLKMVLVACRVPKDEMAERSKNRVKKLMSRSPCPRLRLRSIFFSTRTWVRNMVGDIFLGREPPRGGGCYAPEKFCKFLCFSSIAHFRPPTGAADRCLSRPVGPTVGPIGDLSASYFQPKGGRQVHLSRSGGSRQPENGRKQGPTGPDR